MTLSPWLIWPSAQQTTDDGVVALLHAVPALVAVHAPEAALDGGDLRVAEGIALFLELLDKARAAGGGHVAPVEEAVDIDLLNAVLLGHIEHGENMGQVAVDAAVGQEAHDVQGMAAGLGIFNGLEVDGVLEELAVLDLLGHLGQDLEHDAARAHVGVADLGVAHLPLGQAHVEAGGLEAGVGIFGKEFIEIGGVGNIDGVAAGGRRQSVAVHDNQDCFFAHVYKLLHIK